MSQISDGNILICIFLQPFILTQAPGSTAAIEAMRETEAAAGTSKTHVCNQQIHALQSVRQIPNPCLLCHFTSWEVTTKGTVGHSVESNTLKF